MKTTSFTMQQREFIDLVLSELSARVNAVNLYLRALEVRDLTAEVADMACIQINRWALLIKALDKRPKVVWSQEQPNVFMPYVAQGMLEELIDILKKTPSSVLDTLIVELQKRV